MAIERTFDVIVIGTGIAGLSTAYHLQRLGVHRLALAGPGPQASATSQAAGFISGGQLDNFTRVSQAHTPERAAALWHYGDAAYDALVAYVQQSELAHVNYRRLRLLTSSSEANEARLAVAQMASANIHGCILETLGAATDSLCGSLKARILGVQDDGPRGGWVDPAALIQQLLSDTAKIPRLSAVQSLGEVGGAPLVHLADGVELSCEIVVAAAHLQIRNLLPGLAPALISFADQWSHLAVTGMPHDAIGTAFSANNTHEWGVFSAPNRLRFGGARYLRPMAGIEAQQSSIEPKITKHLLTLLQQTFNFADPIQVLSSHAALDITPCDELPLIGPMFGSSRVLVATGFMGAGLTTGFWAGKCLAELIAQGSAPGLPRFLWPERLRNLSS